MYAELELYYMEFLHLLLKLVIICLLVCNGAEQLVVLKFFSVGKKTEKWFQSKLISLTHIANDQILLFHFLLRLLLVIFQIHQRFLCELQISLELPLGSFQVHADLLFLLQWALKLESKWYNVKSNVEYSVSVGTCLCEQLTSSTCCSSLDLALVRELTLSSSAWRSSSDCWWASWRAFFSLVSLPMFSSWPASSSIIFLTCNRQ